METVIVLSCTVPGAAAGLGLVQTMTISLARKVVAVCNPSLPGPYRYDRRGQWLYFSGSRLRTSVLRLPYLVFSNPCHVLMIISTAQKYVTLPKVHKTDLWSVERRRTSWSVQAAVQAIMHDDEAAPFKLVFTSPKCLSMYCKT